MLAVIINITNNCNKTKKEVNSFIYYNFNKKIYYLQSYIKSKKNYKVLNN